MCELLALSTRHAAHLNVTLEALASHSGPAGGTRDGWGAALLAVDFATKRLAY